MGGMDYEDEWGEGALDTPGPLNGTSEESAIWAQECPGPPPPHSDLRSIPGGGKLSVCLQGHNQHYAPVPPPPTPPQVHNGESHNLLEINSHL